MDAFTTVMTGTVAALAAASALLMLARRPRSLAETLFAVFSGSLALALLRPVLTVEAPAWALVAALGGCATCNAYWLVARALFRGEGGVARRHVAVAVGIAVLIMAYRLALQAGAPRPSVALLGELLTLASSTVLVLAFIEGLRGWSPRLPLAEKRLRVAFLVVYGSCVLAATLTTAWSATTPGSEGLLRLVVAACASAILLLTHVALWWRRRLPVGASVRPDPLSDDDLRLAESLRQLVEAEGAYREPELKVADLARRLQVPEQRVSRAVGQGLGERNFNQWLNRHRVQEACRLLLAHPSRSVLEISADCGFASLGPFNRAFKAVTGTTPSGWRAAQRAARPREHAIHPASPVKPRMASAQFSAKA